MEVEEVDGAVADSGERTEAMGNDNLDKEKDRRKG